MRRVVRGEGWARSWRAPRPEVVAGADELCDALLIRTPREIDLRYVASDQSAVIVYEPLPRGDGALLRSPDGAIISVDERLADQREARLVISHEVGHIVLHPRVGLDVYCRGVVSGSFFQGEIDATDFGSRLMTPTELVRAWLASVGGSAYPLATMQGVAALADAFDVPLGVALVRVVELLDAPIAVVASRGGTIRWWAVTAAFPFPVTRGFALGARAWARAPEAVARDAHDCTGEVVPAVSWSKDRRARGASVIEHSVASGDGALTLLVAVSA